MKKVILILVAGLLWCSSSNAGLKEPGKIDTLHCARSGLEAYNVTIDYLKKKPKKNTAVYLACEGSSYNWNWADGSNLESLHKKSFKECSKNSKKHGNGECFLFSINDKIVWELSEDKAKSFALIVKKSTEFDEEKFISSDRDFKFINFSDEDFIKYTEQHKLTYKNSKDNIPGRFLYDQDDVTDDYQLHAIYVLAADSKDKQFDLKGIIEKIVLKGNKHMKKKTKEKQFRLDLTKDGKLDVSFLRIPLTKKELNQHRDGTIYLAVQAVRNGFYHPKKIYTILYQDKYKDQSGQLGDAILETPTGNVEIQMGVEYLGHSDANNKPHLHETFHALGFTQLCAPGYAKTGPPRWDGRQDHLRFSNDIMSDRDSGSRNIDSKRKHYYGHSNKDCPLDLRKSVFLEPTEKDPQLPPRTKTCRVARWVKKYNHQRSLDCMAKLDF